MLGPATTLVQTLPGTSPAPEGPVSMSARRRQRRGALRQWRGARV